MLLRACAWHEPGQGWLSLPGLDVSHGMCPWCMLRFCLDHGTLYDAMKHGNPEWVKMFNDGGWRQLPGNVNHPMFWREHFGKTQTITCGAGWKQSGPWVLVVDGSEVAWGFLDDCFEAADH